MRSIRGRLGLVLLLGLAGSCGSQARPAAVPDVRPATSVYPGAHWDTVPSPESAGYSRAGLALVREYLRTLPTDGFMAVTGGRVLMTYGDLDTLSYLASARKSILSMLYGAYVARGVIKLDRSLADLRIDDIGGLTPGERLATVRDLLSARSGVFHAASNPGDNLDSAPPRGSQPHGTYYLYSNWDFNALGTIFEQQTGVDVYDALERDFARPIGMEDFRRDIQQKSGDTTRSRHLAYHMVLSTRDMARLGLLMLRRGRWGDRQLIPEEWVRESTRLVTPSRDMHPTFVRDGGLGYGYLWWILEPKPGSPLEGSYSARGAYGQYIMVVPRLDLVISHKRVPGPAQVGWEQFMGAVDRLIAARCHSSC